MTKLIVVFLCVMAASAQETPTVSTTTLSPSVVDSPSPSPESPAILDETIGPSSSMYPTFVLDDDNGDDTDAAVPVQNRTDASIATANTTTVNGTTSSAPPSSSECWRFDSCTALSLSGHCCPTADDWTLTCCGGPVEESCALNPLCAALGLKGACCPTTTTTNNSTNVWLDCCAVVPDECGTTNGSSTTTTCLRQSAVQYKLEIDRVNVSSSSSACGNGDPRRWMVAVIVTAIAAFIRMTGT